MRKNRKSQPRLGSISSGEALTTHRKAHSPMPEASRSFVHDKSLGPLVTVYMPTRNRGDFVFRAAESILQQTYQNIELIIVDDCSEPDIQERLACLAREHPARIQLFLNQRQSGAPASRNRALRSARGQFITGIDDDDVFLPNRLSTFVASWRKEDSFLYADDIFASENRQRVWKKKAASLPRLLSYNCVGNQVFTKTQYLTEVGGFDENLLSAQDYDLWVRLALRYGPGRRIPSATQIVSRSIQQHNRLSSSKMTWRGYYTVYKKHFALMNRTQRKNRLFSILEARGRRLKTSQLLPLLTRSNALNLTRHYLLK